MNIYLKKGNVEGRSKYLWTIQQGDDVAAILEVKFVAPGVDLKEIVDQTPSIWIKRNLRAENQNLDKEAAELRKELAGFMEA